MIIIIQKTTINYLNSSHFKSIDHNQKSREAEVVYDDGSKIRYFDVIEIKFTEEKV